MRFNLLIIIFKIKKARYLTKY